MTIKIGDNQSPKTTDPVIYNEVHFDQIKINCPPQIDGQSLLNATVSFVFYLYGRDSNNNRLYDLANKHSIEVKNFVSLVQSKAVAGNLDYANLMTYLEKVIADVIADQKPQFSSATQE